eukprot:COSAG04_NODE_27323_length_284_cov_0.843243_1_plen_58_part_01
MTAESCVTVNTWEPPAAGFCSNADLTTEATCEQLSRWYAVAPASCSDSSLSTQSSYLQ